MKQPTRPTRPSFLISLSDVRAHEPQRQTQKEETKIQNQVKGTDNIQGWKVFNEKKEKGGGQAICIT